MRKIFNILLSGLFVLGTWSCSEDIMDDINKNVNDPTEVGSHLIITDAMVTSAFSVAGSDLAFYAGVYIEHSVGVWNQSYSAEIRSGEPTKSTTYNNNWNAIYANLYNLKDVITKCDVGGSEEGNFHTLGIAQILSAYNLAVLTDLMGDVPWSEALQPGIIYTPKLDKQEDIYADIMKFLDDAIENLNKDSDFPSLGGQDFIYGGKIGLWEKFAYGLKARYTMRLSKITPKYADVITFAKKSFESAKEQAQFDYNGKSTQSPFYRFFKDRDYFGASKSLHDKLTERSDPRDTIFFTPYPGTEGLEFAPNGSPKQAQKLYSISAISTITAPTYLMSYHEVEFLIAEAEVRLNNGLPNAASEDALRAAVVAAMQKINIGIDADDADEYFDDYVLALFNAKPLEEVMNQKYIAFFEEEAVEAYNDYRRLMAMEDNVIELKNGKNATQFPHRFTYGASDVTTNANVRDAYGDGNYVYTEKVWWAGGTR